MFESTNWADEAWDQVRHSNKDTYRQESYHSFYIAPDSGFGDSTLTNPNPTPSCHNITLRSESEEISQLGLREVDGCCKPNLW
ncbi:hypothetical protein MMYC01_208789 [Madurella mycetomatis]|uniref:Uncharacterized protein n=1 Tax=Madurella mycetomatis TaxID=100816 RepID=A0A175VWE4_9PEZI|nr:hypothetical protein MMYC01_208789 [Madurella mycetomatis]